MDDTQLLSPAPGQGRGAPAPGGDPLLGLELSGYFIKRSLASGAMGVVYEAVHPLISRRVAVKVLKPEVASRPAWAKRFIQEAQAISSIKHRNIVEILNFGVVPDGRQYLMMEFLEGEPLEAMIERGAPLMPVDALRIADEVLSGLSAAHQAGVVHRDLKPANIFLLTQSTGERIVKIVDFGLASRSEGLACVGSLAHGSEVSARRSGDAKSSITAGTPAYVSPEQAAGRQVEASGDLYSLGVILFEMLSGRLPFIADRTSELLRMHMKDLAPALSTEALPVELVDFVARLLAKDPARRPDSANAARAQVQQLLRRVHERSANVGVWNPTTRGMEAEAPATTRALISSRFALWVGALLTCGALGLAAWRPGAPLGLSVAAPLPASEPAAPTPERGSADAPPEVVSQLALPLTKIQARSPQVKCTGDGGWKRTTHQRIDELEKVAMAGLPLDASLAQVAAIKGRARSLSHQMKEAQGTSCAQVEAQLDTWRTQLRR